MSHFICTGGCRGESDEPGTCQSQGCALYAEELQECDCTDGKHHGLFDDEEEPAL